MSFKLRLGFVSRYLQYRTQQSYNYIFDNTRQLNSENIREAAHEVNQAKQIRRQTENEFRLWQSKATVEERQKTEIVDQLNQGKLSHAETQYKLDLVDFLDKLKFIEENESVKNPELVKFYRLKADVLLNKTDAQKKYNDFVENTPALHKCWHEIGVFHKL